jgi:hypothetical protein
VFLLLCRHQLLLMFLLLVVVLLMGLAPLMTLAVLLLAIYSLHLFIATLVSAVLLGRELLM